MWSALSAAARSASILLAVILIKLAFVSIDNAWYCQHHGARSKHGHGMWITANLIGLVMGARYGGDSTFSPGLIMAMFGWYRVVLVVVVVFNTSKLTHKKLTPWMFGWRC
jgi:hypothetical protein